MSRALLLLALAPALAPALAACSGAPAGVDAHAHTIVSLTFDDTFADEQQVGALVASHGMHATFYVNSGRVDLPEYMTRAQLLALQAAGNELAGHTVSHPDLPTLDLAEERRQICTDRVQLLADGFEVSAFAYPFGDTNLATETIVADCGYTSARGVGDLRSGSDCSDCAAANTLPPEDPFHSKTNNSVQIGVTLDDVEAYVTQAEDAGGGWVPIVMHHVCDGCDSLSVPPDTLAAFLDWLAARADGGTVVETVRDVMGGPLLPGVPGPPPDVPVAADGDLVVNASLEVDSNGDGIPDCWERGGTGTNDATYTLTTDASDGHVASQLVMTSYTSGERRLMTAQDLGSCAPSVTPGHAYTMTAHYIASAPPRFSVSYRTPEGGWLFLANSPAFAVSSTYATARYTTPPLPAGATALSIGLSLDGVGELTTDAYDLRDAAPPGSH